MGVAATVGFKCQNTQRTSVVVIRAKYPCLCIALALMFILALAPSIADEDEIKPWEGFTITANYDAIVDGYNEKHLALPEEMLKALDDNWVVFFFYKTSEQVQTAGTRTIITTHSAVFKDGVITRHTSVEFPEPTLRVYMTEKAFYEFVTGERGLKTLSRENSLRYDAVGIGRSIRLSWLKFKYGLKHLFKKDKTFLLYVPQTIVPIKDPLSFREVSHCASAGQPNVLVQQLLTVKNCTGCAVEYVLDRCLGRFSLLELSCGEGNTLREEVVDCGALNKICSNGACTRDTSRATNLKGFTAAERLLAITSQDLDCYESDSGNAPEERGTVFWRGNDGSVQQFGDFCVSSEKLTEFFCSGDGSVGSEEVSCKDTGQICFHRACIASTEIGGTGTLEEILAVEAVSSSDYEPCVDSDNGDIPETKGTVTVKGCPTCAATTYADECMTSAIIQEQYCTGDTRRERYENCQDFGYPYCDAGRCTSEDSSDVTKRRLEELMDADAFLRIVVNVSGVRCMKQRTTFSMFAGDARDRVFHKLCDTCNYTIYEDDCYNDRMYEFNCVSPDGPVEFTAQKCTGNKVCYRGACVERGNITDYEYFIEQERHEATAVLTNCSDTDNGIVPRTKGRVELNSCPFCPAKTEHHIYWDTCASDTQVNEQYCEGETRQSKKMSCAESGRVCSDGACVFS